MFTAVNYYNEYDKKTAAWLRELIKAGLIPDGVVDERSITDVRSSDLAGYTQCHFFAGIGGWSLALQLAGWPSDRPVWTGSCPCQPFSTAGKGLAQADERHLWPVFFNLIKECRPEHVFGEQVASAIGKGWLDGISADLGEEGYACGSAVLGAHSVGSPHIRQRLYWAANSNSGRFQQCDEGIGSVPEFDKDGANGGVGDSSSERHNGQHSLLWKEEPRRDTGDILQATWPCEAGGLGESINAGPQGHGRLIQQHDSQGWEGEERYSAETGFWSDFTTVACRDGKTRRIPTESILQRVANGIPLAMDYLRDIVCELETQITRYAKETNKTTIEVVREMQFAFWSEAIQWDARGRISLLSPEILLASLLQLERKLGGVEFCSSQGIISAQEAIMLRVREDAAKEATPCSSHGWGYAQQLAREFADALYELSYENALEAAQDIFDRALGFPLTTKCPSRTTLLRGYGNAIVPQVAAEFVKAYLEISR
jgi:DNA (cytosine-5)-methyltransferase 1